MKQQVPANALTVFDNPLILLSPDAQSHINAGYAAYGSKGLALLPVIQSAVKQGLAQGIHDVFVLTLLLMITGLILASFLKESPLRKRQTHTESETLSENEIVNVAVDEGHHQP